MTKQPKRKKKKSKCLVKGFVRLSSLLPIRILIHYDK